MNMKRINVALAATLLAGFAYWFGYQTGSSKRATISTVSSLKVIGVRFRSEHNDISRFTVTGTVAIPNPKTQAQ